MDVEDVADSDVKKYLVFLLDKIRKEKDEVDSNLRALRQAQPAR
jgi:hypothetical protein